MVHLEDVLVREPARRRRPHLLDELASAVEEAQACRSEEVLEHARAEEVDAQRLHVDREGADRLVHVEQHVRAVLVRKLDDGGHVDHRAVPVADVRDRDDQRVVVDRAREALDRNRSVGPGGDVDDARTA